MTQRTLGRTSYSQYGGGEGTVPAHANPTTQVRPGGLVAVVPNKVGQEQVVKIYAEADPQSTAQNAFSIHCDGWRQGDPMQTVQGPQPIQTAAD